MERATFAGGCFWCMEAPFAALEGVSGVTYGYMGGHKDNPTYEEVSDGITGHAEVVQMDFDPSRISYEKLLEVFWMNIDPTTPNQQFADQGSQYRSAIFFHTPEQQRLAEESMNKLEASRRFGDKKIVTEITAASAFWPAEDYHQEYYKKNPTRYKLYRQQSGREGFLRNVWEKAPE